MILYPTGPAFPIIIYSTYIVIIQMLIIIVRSFQCNNNYVLVCV